jgi:hypothetical protein
MVFDIVKITFCPDSRCKGDEGVRRNSENLYSC